MRPRRREATQPATRHPTAGEREQHRFREAAAMIVPALIPIAVTVALGFGVAPRPPPTQPWRSSAPASASPWRVSSLPAPQPRPRWSSALAAQEEHAPRLPPPRGGPRATPPGRRHADHRHRTCRPGHLRLTIPLPIRLMPHRTRRRRGPPTHRRGPALWPRRRGPGATAGLAQVGPTRLHRVATWPKGGS